MLCGTLPVFAVRYAFVRGRPGCGHNATHPRAGGRVPARREQGRTRQRSRSIGRAAAASARAEAARICGPAVEGTVAALFSCLSPTRPGLSLLPQELR